MIFFHLVVGLTGFGCDTTTVSNILAHRDSMQRGYIQQEYKTMYSEELSRRISSELSGNHKVWKIVEKSLLHDKSNYCTAILAEEVCLISCTSIHRVKVWICIG